MPTTPSPPRRKGRPTRFPGKDRTRVITFTLNDEGWRALERLERSGRDRGTRADLIGELIVEAARRL